MQRPDPWCVKCLSKTGCNKSCKYIHAGARTVRDNYRDRRAGGLDDEEYLRLNLRTGHVAGRLKCY